MHRENETGERTTLILGGTGKTGRRVVERLAGLGERMRVGSRRGQPAFSWEDPSTWTAALRDVAAAYITYYPDIAVPGAGDAIRSFVDVALEHGARRLVLLSGRGEEEAQRAEEILRSSGADWTILRASWFAQNFSEGFVLDSILAGEVVLPAGDVPEPFIDADDIADVAVATLTQDGHVGQLYELTGRRMLTFAEAVHEISNATRRDVRYVQVSRAAFKSALAEQGLPDDIVWILDYLFSTVLDGRSAYLTDGVQRALGRAPRYFADYARAAAASGVWNPQSIAQPVDFAGSRST